MDGVPKRPPDPRFSNILIDANIVDEAFPADEVQAMDRLAELQSAGLGILLPYTVKNEINHPSTPASVKQLASSYIFSIDVGNPPSRFYPQVRDLLRGNSIDNRHDADARNLCEAHTWGRFFVTLDKRILKRAEPIRALLAGLWVLKPSELVELYDHHVAIDPHPMD